jgi:hypothetical protein
VVKPLHQRGDSEGARTGDARHHEDAVDVDLRPFDVGGTIADDSGLLSRRWTDG